MRVFLCLLVALMLGACATTGSGSSSSSGGYSPHRCDRNGDEHQRRAC